MKNVKLKLPGRLFLAFCAFNFAVAVLAADGLSTPFADVRVANVPVGVAYNLLNQGKQLELRNLGSAPIQVQVDVLKPADRELRDTAQAIPDTGWIEIHPNHLEIGPHGKAACDVLITVPSRRAYRNKLYQATLWSRSMPAGGGSFRLQAGLLSRLRFTTQ
jgi:hypothetical protein